MRIRTYVWVEGLSIGVVWLCLTFWAGLALDYLPVLLGSDEMPRLARALLLVVIAGVLGMILFRWILRRTFVRLADRSMAVLLERRHRAFQDSLITSVELVGRDQTQLAHSESMLEETEHDALKTLNQVRLSSIFDARPLVFSLFGAVVLAATIGGVFAATRNTDPNLLELGFRRLYLLDDNLWPRNAKIEVVGVQVQRDEELLRTDEGDSLVEFVDQRLKVARGASLNLSVRANAAAKKIPDMCSVYYRTSEGERGRVNMTRVGGIRDGYQYYRYDGKPFKGIVSSVDFDVVGFDHRARDYKIEVVDSPLVVDAELDCVFPDYMVDEELSQWLPHTVPLTTATQLPRGTRFTLRATTNKVLKKVYLYDSNSEQTSVIEPDGTSFEVDIRSLGETLSLEVSLQDADNVMSDRPYRIYVVGVGDQAPAVNVRLHGIGSAITQNAIVPVRGQIDDDYRVADSWFDLSVNDGDPRELQLKTARDGSVEAAVDFREQRATEDGVKLEPGDKLTLAVKAMDRYDLGDEPNTGTGDHYQLEVVTDDKLLSLLEARELGLRKRFEQIKSEMTEMRESLVRVRNEGPQAAMDADEPGDSEPATDDAAGPDTDGEAKRKAEIERTWSLRLLRSQRAKLQGEKSAQETSGVAASFGDIREELINNRVDTEDRKERIQTQVVEPLKSIASTMFPELEQSIDALTTRLDERSREAVDPTEEDSETVTRVEAALAKTEAVLLAMDNVLQNMLDIEDFNELLDRVRDLIAEQEGLLDETKKGQKQQILDLLQ
ncbi:MAG: hypothetical protein CMJ64_11315 [Planctomycetaceae bacterium]|nr:hypothetical protein [Planctomycetaceae bacterium]